MCPPSSTPPLTGDACGLPSARSVMSSMRWRGRTNSSSSSSPTSVFVAMFGAMTSRLATAAGSLAGAVQWEVVCRRQGDHLHTG